LYGAENWTLRKLDQKYLERFEMLCWRRMEIISWTDRVRNGEVLLRVKEERNIIHKIKRGKVKWIGHILRRNCLPKHFIGGRIEVMRRRGIRCKLILKERILENGKRNTRYHPVENSLWQFLWQGERNFLGGGGCTNFL